MDGCETKRKELVELVFGDPDEERAARINLHLIECAACRREERELLRLREELGRADPEPGDALRERIRAALPARKKRRPVLRFLGAPVPAYAAAAAILLTAILVRGVRPGTERFPAGPERIALDEGESVRFAAAGSYETWVGSPAAFPSDSVSDPGLPPVDSL